MENYLIPAAIAVVSFILGALINGMSKSKKVKVLTEESNALQTRFYELQNSSKKQLSEKETLIKQLRKQEKKYLATPISVDGELLELRDRNKSLEKELKNISANLTEMKVEKAVKKVDQKFPVKIFTPPKKKEKQNEKENKSKSAKSSKNAKSVKVGKTKKDKAKKAKLTKLKSKKSKKKKNSKSRKPKKVLDLINRNKTSKKNKIKKKKNRKSK